MRGKKEIRLHEALGTVRKLLLVLQEMAGCPVARVLPRGLALTNCKSIVAAWGGFVKGKMERSKGLGQGKQKTSLFCG